MTATVRDETMRGRTGASQVPGPPKLRRRPMLTALGVALMAMGGLLAAYLVTNVSSTVPVLALRVDVDRGSRVQASDLVVAQIDSDPALQPVPASERDAIVGLRARRDLSAGGLLTQSDLTSQAVPAAGDSLVGVALDPSQLPAEGVRQGDAVRVIATPGDQATFSSDEVPASFQATVVGIHELTDVSQVVVDVTISSKNAASLAALVGTGNVALIDDGAHPFDATTTSDGSAAPDPATSDGSGGGS